MFRSRRHDSIGDITASRDHVLSTLEASGLEKSSIIVVGGAALALMGIRAARDVDTLTAVEPFNELKRSGVTPSGQPLFLKPDTRRRRWLETKPSGASDEPLHLEIGEFAIPHRIKTVSNDELMREFIARNPIVDGWYHLNPASIAGELQQRSGKKAKHDLSLLRQWRQQSR